MPGVGDAVDVGTVVVVGVGTDAAVVPPRPMKKKPPASAAAASAPPIIIGTLLWAGGATTAAIGAVAAAGAAATPVAYGRGGTVRDAKAGVAITMVPSTPALALPGMCSMAANSARPKSRAFW